jgi:Double-GTPase 2/Bacterial SH3 domain
MGYLILILLIIALYCLYIYVLFYVSFLLFPIGCLVFIGAVLFNYLATMWSKLFLGDGWKDSPQGSEPAYRQYYFRKAYYDYKQVVEESWKPNRAAAKWVIDVGTKLFTNGGVLFTWPLGVMFFLLAAAGAVAGAIAYLTFGLVHLLLVIVCAVTAISLALLSRLVEYVSMLWRRIFLVCPNAGCYKKIGLPIYICPNCGVKHHKLIPGTYGIFKRQCQCGAWLPTLFLFGRNKLPSICPHEECGRPLPSSMGVARNLHVPVVGGPAAGKTSFLMASMLELNRRADSGLLGLEFPEKKHQALYERCSRDFLSGSLLGKTAEDSPDAFLVKLNDGNEKLLYMYDAAGELYQQTDVLRRHEYYSYTHGILFLLDPFSLPQVQSDFETSLQTASAQIKPCEERPQDVYDRMIGTLRQFSKMKGSFGSVPVAVVVTKADAFGLGGEIESAGNGAAPNDKQKDNDPESRAVRQWLMDHGEGNLIRSIEHDFKKTRYFHCSALGRLPDASSSPFVPEGVLDPLQWMMSGYGLKLDGSGRLSLRPSPATHGGTPAPFAVKVGGRSFNGMVISSLWVVATACLMVAGVLALTNIPEWNLRRNSSRYDMPAYTSTPQPNNARTGGTNTDVNLRSSPNSSSSKVGLAERGSRLRVLRVDSSGTWYEVEILQHGRAKADRTSADRGWINGKYLYLD